ncbi:MAG: hypothetical protein HY720_07035 [Planctomycetes bacterium]|nr:hypothetical protein [Planctomycetota bacterium]
MPASLSLPEFGRPPGGPANVWLSALAAGFAVLGLFAAVGFSLAAILVGDPGGSDAREGEAAPPPATPEEIDSLVTLLGSDDPKSRSHAERRLIEIGPAALPSLRRALHSPDPETAWRAEEAAIEIEERRAEKASLSRSAPPGP